MTDRSLSSLFRRLNAESSLGAIDLLDAETLVDASEGRLRGDRRDEVAMRLSRSRVQTDLVRLLRELAPASAQLVSQVGEREVAGHQRSGRSTRHAARLQRHLGLRWAGLAACLAVALGIGVYQQRGLDADEAAMAAAMEAAARPDRIFTSVDQIFSARHDAALPTSPADRVFNTDFNGG
ncbi:MAG: hypothetical protein ABI650_04230 [Dokdonella sp.]